MQLLRLRLRRSAGTEPRPDQDFRHTAEGYSLGEVLGQGSMGTVRMARQRSTNRSVAVKIIKTEQAEMQARARTAAHMWNAVGRHENLVELVQVFVEERAIAMVMERCQCSLADKFFPGHIGFEPQLFEGDRLRRVLRQMLLGIQACHAACIVHRDVNADNFMIGMDGTVKLADFKLAICLPQGQLTTGECGTPPFMSPEMVKGEEYGAATDIWSFAASAYSLIFDGELPYIPEVDFDASSAKRAIVEGAPPRHLEADRPGAAFLKLVLERDQHRRCSIEEALQHPFLKDAATQPATAQAGNARHPGKAAPDAKKKTTLIFMDL